VSDASTLPIAADERARVPFALVGVLLLVSSTAYAGVLSARGPVIEDRSVDRAMDRASADATPAIRHAVATAARDAAREPVTAPADTAAGDAIRPGTAFEDALRIRIYLAAERALDATAAREGDVRAVATLPAVEEPANLDRARDRVTVEPVEGGRALRATVRNVTVRTKRGDRVVATERANVTVTVAVPVLAAHERTVEFERRLNRGPLDGPGLGRQLTASLYPMAWARGYAQYGGAPVANVIANRHVELAANAGLIRTQAATFSGADPAARRGLARATVRTGTADLLAPTPVDERRWTRAVLASPAGAEPPADEREGAPSRPSNPDAADYPGPDDGMEVGVDRAADVAFRRLLEGEFGETLADAYRVEARVETAARRVGTTGVPTAESPGAGWTLVGESTHTRYAVRGTGDPDGFGTATREVRAMHTVTYRWARGEERRTTKSRYTERYRVTVRVAGEYAPTGGAPSRPTRPRFERGGALDGPNLADAPDRAQATLTDDGVDAIARSAVAGGDADRTAVVHGKRPLELDAWVYDDLAALRETVRNVTVEVDRGRVARGDVAPAAALAAELRARRSSLVDAPAAYDGAADRARVAARAAYLDAVVAELERRAAGERTADDGYADALEGIGGASGDDLDAVMDARSRARGDHGPTGPMGAAGGRPAATADEETAGSGLTGDAVPLEPRGSPGYLPRTVVTGEHARAVPEGEIARPLAVRNVNLVTVPYGEAASGIVDRVLGGDSVPLPAAGRTLAATERTVRETGDADPELQATRAELAAAVESGLRVVDRAALAVLAEETDLPEAEREAAVAAAAARWNGTADRATAVGSGAYADAVAAEAADRGELSAREHDRLAVALRVAVADAAASEEARVRRSAVMDAGDVTRRVAREELAGVVESGLRGAGSRAADRWMPSAMRGVGAGLPVAPVPGYWYATVNAWRVEVRGAYPRFVVRAPDRAAGGPGESFAYVREAGTATVRIDGETVRLGATEPVRFETGTTVVIAVPPGPPGVGDVDGTRNERSPAWPCPDGTASGGVSAGEACG